MSLSGVVVGPLSLHDFYKKPLHRAIEAISPLYTYGSAHYLAPADFATIYNVDPAYSAGYDGAGTSVAIVARTDITLSDVQSFRNYFGIARQ